jgi:hypothetical protein
MFVVQPADALLFGRDWEKQGTLISDEFRYASNTNSEWLDLRQINSIIAPIEQDYLAGKL